MVLKNGTADRESHAHAGGLRGVERLKDPCLPCSGQDPARSLRRSPAPDPHQCCRVRDNQFPWPLTYSAHRFDRIHDQVQHYLLQLNPIAETGKRSSANCVRIVTSVSSSLCRRPAQGLPELVSFRSSLSLGGAAPLCQSPNTGDHVTGSLAVAHDVADSFTDFLQVGRISGQPAQAGTAVAHYPG